MRNCILIFFLFISGYSFAVNDIDSLQAVLNKSPNDLNTKLQLGIAYHNLGVNGDKSAVKKSEELLKELLVSDSSNTLILGYYGSALCLKARDSSMPWNKSKYAKQGFAWLDSAITTDPERIELRMLRAMNSYQVPKFLNRLEIGINDYLHVIESNKFEEFSPHQQAKVYYHLANSYKKNSQNKKADYYYGLTVQISPDSEFGLMSKSNLNKD